MGTTTTVRPEILAILRHADLSHRIFHYCDHKFLPDTIALEYFDVANQAWRSDGTLSDVDDMLEMQAYYRCSVTVLRGDAAGVTASGT
jgi:hypothetical protein